jgi:hypothetical protein
MKEAKKPIVTIDDYIQQQENEIKNSTKKKSSIKNK